MAYLPQPIDPYSTSLVATDIWHNAIHRGIRFGAQFSTSFGAAASTNLRMNTPSGMNVHAYVSVECNTETIFQIIEGPSITTTGSAYPSYNMNRVSANTASASVFQTATYTNGTAIYVDRFGFSGGGATQARGGSDVIDFIGKRNTDYIFFVSSLGAGSLAIALDWVERPTA